jgi:hypothetical protein
MNNSRIFRSSYFNEFLSNFCYEYYITGLVADSGDENCRHFHSLMTNLSNSLDSSILHLPESKKATLFTTEARSFDARKSFGDNYSRVNADEVKVYFALKKMETEDPVNGSFYFDGEFE